MWWQNEGNCWPCNNLKFIIWSGKEILIRGVSVFCDHNFVNGNEDMICNMISNYTFPYIIQHFWSMAFGGPSTDCSWSNFRWTIANGKGNATNSVTHAQLVFKCSSKVLIEYQIQARVNGSITVRHKIKC